MASQASGPFNVVYYGLPTSTSVTGLVSNTIYGFVVQAENSFGNSTQSTVTYLNTSAPTMPTGLQTVVMTTNAITIEWQASVDAGKSQITRVPMVSC